LAAAASNGLISELVWWGLTPQPLSMQTGPAWQPFAVAPAPDPALGHAPIPPPASTAGSGPQALEHVRPCACLRPDATPVGAPYLRLAGASLPCRHVKRSGAGGRPAVGGRILPRLELELPPPTAQLWASGCCSGSGEAEWTGPSNRATPTAVLHAVGRQAPTRHPDRPALPRCMTPGQSRTLSSAAAMPCALLQRYPVTRGSAVLHAHPLPSLDLLVLAALNGPDAAG